MAPDPSTDTVRETDADIAEYQAEDAPPTILDHLAHDPAARKELADLLVAQEAAHRRARSAFAALVDVDAAEAVATAADRAVVEWSRRALSTNPTSPKVTP